MNIGNAAMREMKSTGFMHNLHAYVLGEKNTGWSPSPGRRFCDRPD
jgi:deoxyribodipyrimidine photolyase